MCCASLAIDREEELDVAIILEQADKTSCVRLQGSIDISLAEELKRILADALNSGKEIRVFLGETAYLDVTAIQLLWAAEREAGSKGVAWAFADPVPEPIRSLLREAGFEESLFVWEAAEPGGEIA
jgi:anti-anti-sigma factor